MRERMVSRSGWLFPRVSAMVRYARSWSVGYSGFGAGEGVGFL
jgi:hypothetical protein